MYKRQVYALSASGSNWSISNCSNYVGEGGASGAVSFSADCDLASSFWSGPVSLLLSVDDASTGVGSINISANGLSVTLDGAVDFENSTGNTLVGDTSATLFSGVCCASGQVDCAGGCDTVLINTGIDGLGTDCNNVCGGDAELLNLGWSSGSWASETSWTLSDASGVLSQGSGGASGSTCFLTGVDYSLTLCDEYNDGCSGNILQIGD